MLKTIRGWRKDGQRGGVLSALLITVAFLAILGSAMLNMISGQFLLTQTLGSRIADEATLNSSVELAIGVLQDRVADDRVPSQCVSDTNTSVPGLSLNGRSASVTPAPYCQAIVPDFVQQLPTGDFSIDGTQAFVNGGTLYLVADTSGWLYAYRFGQSTPLWSVRAGGVSTGPIGQRGDTTLVPVGNGVARVDDSSATYQCTMAAAGMVSSSPGFENGPNPFFPDYAYFGDTGRLYVYSPDCHEVADAPTGGAVVGGPLVLSGTQTTQRQDRGQQVGDEVDVVTTTTTEVYAIVNAAGASRLVHYTFMEQKDSRGTTNQLSPDESVGLGIDAAGVAFSGTTPVDRQTIRLAVTLTSGEVAMAGIGARQRDDGWTYTTSLLVGPVALSGAVSRPPYWCHCPSPGGGVMDLVGTGTLQGHFYVLDPNRGLATVWHFDAPAAIGTTPAADPNGSWYFGAEDGYVYDVEPPAGGAQQMFKAARFGPGRPVLGSPVAGGCGGRICVYFGAQSDASYLAQIGNGRLMELNGCLNPGSGSTACSRQLSSLVEVGDRKYVGGGGVNVLTWSYSGG